MEDYLTATEAAEALGIAYCTLLEWLNRRDPTTNQSASRLDHVRIGSRGRNKQGRIYVHKDTIKAFLAANTIKASASESPKCPISPPRHRKYLRRNF